MLYNYYMPISSHGSYAKFLDLKKSTTYLYKKNLNLNPHKQKIYDEEGDSFEKWLYKNAYNYLRQITNSYKEFKKKINLRDNKLIGVVFYAENYEAVGYRDNDRSEQAVGFCFDTILIEKGYFIYPKYDVAIEIMSNSFWYQKTQVIHGIQCKSSILYINLT